jgi:ABC-2 type transport system permease protein
MRIVWTLTVASFKMYIRQREAIIWTFVFPLLVIVLFSFVKFDGLGKMHLGVVNEAGSEGTPLLAALKNVKSFEVTEGSKSVEVQELEKGERDIVLLIPSGFHDSPDAVLTAYADAEAKPQEAQLGSLILQRVLDELTFSRTPHMNRALVHLEPLKTRNLAYIDFLIPGVLAMSIMQMGIFGVAFSFVSLKKRGILRRLWVTPIRPVDFVAAQVATRVVVLLLQIALMIGVGILFLHLHFAGNLLSLFVVGLLGAVIFLGFGFAIAGISRSEDQVAPLANIISLPMMLLSGVFFSRSNLPGFIHTITDFFPLTYLADGMRSIAIDGASLLQIGPQVIGLVVWGAIAVVIAIKMFRWE